MHKNSGGIAKLLKLGSVAGLDRAGLSRASDTTRRLPTKEWIGYRDSPAVRTAAILSRQVRVRGCDNPAQSTKVYVNTDRGPKSEKSHFSLNLRQSDSSSYREQSLNSQ